ncbi:hypothetical protein D3C75_699440 [compost metagenome]
MVGYLGMPQEGEGQIPPLIKQPARECRGKGHSEFPVNHREHASAGHHCPPHAKKLCGGTAKSGDKTSSMCPRVRIAARGDEGGVLQRAPSIYCRVQEGDERGFQFPVEFLIEPCLQKLQQIFVGHMQEVRLPLQPARREGTNPPDLIGFPIQTDRCPVHRRNRIIQLRLLNPVIDVPGLARTVQRLQPAGRPLQKVRQRNSFELFHHRLRQAIAADYRLSVLIGHRLKPCRLKTEIGRGQPSAHFHRPVDAFVDFVQELAKRLTNYRKVYRLLFAGDPEADTLTVCLTGRGYGIPVRELGGFACQYSGYRLAHLLQ